MNPERLLPDRDCQVADDGEPIILPQALETVVGDTVSAEACVITLEESSFKTHAPLGIPVHRHHVREIGGGTSDPPVVPVDQTNAGTGGTVAWIEQVPDVRIAVANRVGRIETRGSDQAIARVVNTRVDGARCRPQSVIERACEARITLAILGRDLCQRGLVEECAHATTEARVTPPERVKARPGVDNALARLVTRR